MKIILVLACVIACVAASGYGNQQSRGHGHNSGYGKQQTYGLGHNSGHGKQSSGYGSSNSNRQNNGYGDYRFKYQVEQGDKHAHASFGREQTPKNSQYNVYQSHPYGGESTIYNSAYTQQGYGYGHH